MYTGPIRITAPSWLGHPVLNKVHITLHYITLQVWTLCKKEALGRVLRMQKQAACVILEAQRTSRTVTFLSWIPFYKKAYIKRCELAYKRTNGTIPDYLNASLKKTFDAHSRTSRNFSLNLLCPLHKNISEGWTHLCRKDGKGLEQFASITKNK